MTTTTTVKAAMMTAEDIAKEIFGDNIKPRLISEHYAFKKGFPKAYQVGPRSKKFWRRAEIYEYYKLNEAAA